MDLNIANCVIVNVNIKNNYILIRGREDNYKLHKYGNESEYDSELCKHEHEYTYNCVNIDRIIINYTCIKLNCVHVITSKIIYVLPTKYYSNLRES